MSTFNYSIRIIFLLLTTSVLAQTSTQNYVEELTAREPLSGSIVNLRTTPTKVQTDITYVDGLGRTSQTIQLQATPDFKDLVTPFYYDPMGRMDKDALPYKSAASSGNYRSNWYNEHNSYYQNTQSSGTVANVNYPYSKRTYESSPLNRVIETSSPGEVWKPSVFQGSHVVNYEYRINIQNGGTNDDNIRIFEVDHSGSQTIYSPAYYATGELYVSSVTDEDGNVMLEFTNTRGLLICKISAYGTPESTRTYYVYDDLDRLSFIIPPQAWAEVNNNWDDLNDFSFRDKWLFRYKYDRRDRMIEKQVPGAAMIEMVYDKRDRLVFILDGNRREIGSTSNRVEYVTSGTLELTSYQGKSYVRSPDARIILKQPGFQASKLDNFSVQTSATVYPSEWLYTKYDDLNRPVMTGLKSMTHTRESLQDAVDMIEDYDFAVDYVGIGGTNFFGYDDSSYPSAVGTEILTVTYYDHYNFISDLSWGSDYLYPGHFANVKGLVTGGLSKILGSNPSKHLKSVNYYDDRLRQKASMAENYFGEVDESVTTYRNIVSSLVMNTTSIHRKGTSATTVIEEFTYDHRDRLLTNTHKIVGHGTKPLVTNTFNDIGQLIRKDLHDDGTPAQSVDYRYNERGWLSTINGGPNNLLGNDKFGLELQYGTGTNPKYNGNIGKMLWKSLGGTNVTTATQGYQYSYDALNRLTTATYFPSGTYDVTNITYDKNGNLQSLARNTIDDLDFEYVGNQLSRAQDVTNNVSGFLDVSSSVGTLEYRYDKNGNMISDSNQGITDVQYNFLNLPEQITIDNENIFYIYDAAGNKHKKVYNGKEWTYVGPFHYEKEVNESDAQLEFLKHSEGRVLYGNGSWDYEYNLYDHVGNVRVTVDESGALMQRDDYYPYGLTFNHWSFGTESLYKLSNNEQQKEWGVYDFNARNYSPALGRFLQIDPLSNDREGLTPYNYVQLNPVKRMDPSGLLDHIYYRNGREVMRIKNDEPNKYFELRENEDFVTGYETVQIKNPVRNPSVLQGTNKTNYIYSEQDIKVRLRLLSLGKQNIITNELLKREEAGDFQPVSGAEYTDTYKKKWGTDKAFWMAIEQKYFSVPGWGGANGGAFSRGSLAGYQKGLAKFSNDLSKLKRPDVSGLNRTERGFSANFRVEMKIRVNNQILPRNPWNRFQNVNKGKGKFATRSEARDVYKKLFGKKPEL